MEKTRHDAYLCSFGVVLIFGTLCSVLVIISILRQKRIMKNKHNFLVLPLAIWNLGALITYLLSFINFEILEEPFFDYTQFYCLASYVIYFFQVNRLRNRYDVDDFSASSQCYCPSLKTCHQSTEIESRLWFIVHCWYYSGIWTSSAKIVPSKYMKNVCSNRVRQSAPCSSFNIQKFLRNRKIVLVLLISVPCYAEGNIPIIAYLSLHVAQDDTVLRK